jgi:hypothetical protein
VGLLWAAALFAKGSSGGKGRSKWHSDGDATGGGILLVLLIAIPIAMYYMWQREWLSLQVRKVVTGVGAVAWVLLAIATAASYL